ncbi:unnamed protein product [Cylindrotheca closterium]|uniref:Uncharacterized protein n=1 Tax=Cylindrotheca closterium TaxID=2856 RepID=A0AAD2FSH9_9STRA|nr:unnamed protein product [Cylindrotheca closterium]
MCFPTDSRSSTKKDAAKTGTCPTSSSSATAAASSSSSSTHASVRTTQTRQQQRQTSGPTFTASNTLIVKRSRWTHDPSSILESAQKNDQITSLHFIGLQFSEASILRLIQLLESPRNSENDNNDTCSSGWNCIFFSNCRFPNPSIGRSSPVTTTTATTTTNSNNSSSNRWRRSNYQLPSKSTPCQQLARVLAQTQMEKLIIHESVHLTSALLMVVEDSGMTLKNTKGLTIQQRHGLTNAQCQALGKLVACSKGLKELSLRGTPIPSGALLAPGLAISYHLETLILGDSYLSKQSLNDLVLAAPDRKAIQYGLVNNSLATSIQATKRLLNTPRSNLSALDLSNLHLNDNHVEILAPLLTDPNSKLQQLNLSFNRIGDRGLAIFCQHLPKMHKLSKVSLNPNPWKDGKMLCDAMKQNTSIEYLDSLLFLPEAKMLRYYTTINRGGRRLMQEQRKTGGEGLPLGLWANLLERAGKVQYFVQDQEQAKANSIYYLLSNGPVFFDQP